MRQPQQRPPVANASTARTEPELVVLPDPDAVSRAAAERIADALGRAVERRGRADWATTGGSTVVGIYSLLAVSPLRERVPWSAVHIWWGDERYVPRDHPMSNTRPVDMVLASAAARGGQSGTGEDADDVLSGRDPGAPIPVANIHPFPVAEALGASRGPAWAATRYEAEMRSTGIPTESGWPVFDLVLLGVGPDGHLLSVFPGSAAWDEATAWAVPVPAPSHVEPHVTRVSLNPRIVDAAREILVVSHGEGKAGVLAEVFGPDRHPRRWPAQLARRTGATWILDRAAAAKIQAP